VRRRILEGPSIRDRERNLVIIIHHARAFMVVHSIVCSYHISRVFSVPLYSLLYIASATRTFVVIPEQLQYSTQSIVFATFLFIFLNHIIACYLRFRIWRVLFIVSNHSFNYNFQIDKTKYYMNIMINQLYVVYVVHHNQIYPCD
jgi:hypothetical protein